MDTKGLQKEFISWCKSKNKSPKSEDETKLLFVAFMKEKHPEEYKKAVENQLKQQQAQTKKALHGAKLNYFKSLKNQCAEDEEVVYYKKGGSVSCGCKKKEDGGQVKKDCGGSAIANFKAARKAKLGDTLTRIADATGSQGGFKKAQQAKLKQEAENKKKELDARFKKGQVRVGKDILKGTNNVTKKEREDVTKDKCGSKIKKHQEGSVITQFKKHRLGGSLNGIPFMQTGTPKAGIRYKGGKKDSFKNENHENVDVIMGQKPNFYTHAPLISRIISSDGNDTTFVEIPEHTSFTTVNPRVAKNNWTEDLNNKKIYSNSPEYYTMRRRFSEASLVSPGKFKFFVPKPYTPLKYTFGN